MEERGLGFWETSPPWRSYATLGDGPLASGALLSAGLGLGQCEGLTLSSAHAPQPSQLLPTQQPLGSLCHPSPCKVLVLLYLLALAHHPCFWSLEHCLSDAISCCSCFLSVCSH